MIHGFNRVIGERHHLIVHGKFSLSSQIVAAFLSLPIVPCLVNSPVPTMRIISVNHKGDDVNLLFETVSKDTNRPPAVIQV